MKRKTNKKLLLILVLTVVFAFSSVLIVNAKDTYTKNAFISGCNASLYNDFTDNDHLSFLNDVSIYVHNENKIIVIYHVTNLSQLITKLNNDYFINASVSASVYLGLDSNTNNVYSALRNNENYESNLQEICYFVDNIGALFRQNINYTSQNNELLANNETLLSEITTLNSERETLLNEITTLNNERETLLNDVRVLEIDKQELLTYNETLLNENLNFRHQISSYVEENATLNEKYNILFETSKENYQKGFNDGMNESDVLEKGLVTVFSSPMYIFGEMFNFEIFGINILSIVQFLITISIVGIVVSKIRG